jgi:hypothetical protein
MERRTDQMVRFFIRVIPSRHQIHNVTDLYS